MNIEAYRHQVGGHSRFMKPKDSSKVYKPLIENEFRFYEKLSTLGSSSCESGPLHILKKFLPQYYGTTEICIHTSFQVVEDKTTASSSSVSSSFSNINKSQVFTNINVTNNLSSSTALTSPCVAAGKSATESRGGAEREEGLVSIVYEEDDNNKDGGGKGKPIGRGFEEVRDGAAAAAAAEKERNRQIVAERPRKLRSKDLGERIVVSIIQPEAARSSVPTTVIGRESGKIMETRGREERMEMMTRGEVGGGGGIVMYNDDMSDVGAVAGSIQRSSKRRSTNCRSDNSSSVCGGNNDNVTTVSAGSRDSRRILGGSRDNSSSSSSCGEYPRDSISSSSLGGSGVGNFSSSTTTTTTVREKSSLIRHIVLEDLVYGFKKPCVIDIKMGKRQRKLGATVEKEKRQLEKSLKTTSHELGFRLCGCQYYDKKSDTLCYRDKYWGRKLTKEKVPWAIRQWFWNGYALYEDLIPPLLDKLQTYFNCVAQLRHYRFWSSSLLWVYDGGLNDAEARTKSLDIRVIDFANTIYLQVDFDHFSNSKGLTFKRVECDDDDNPAPDEEYLFGLRTLLEALQTLLASLHRPSSSLTTPALLNEVVWVEGSAVGKSLTTKRSLTTSTEAQSSSSASKTTMMMPNVARTLSAVATPRTFSSASGGRAMITEEEEVKLSSSQRAAKGRKQNPPWQEERGGLVGAEEEAEEEWENDGRSRNVERNTGRTDNGLKKSAGTGSVKNGSLSGSFPKIIGEPDYEHKTSVMEKSSGSNNNGTSVRNTEELQDLKGLSPYESPPLPGDFPKLPSSCSNEFLDSTSSSGAKINSISNSDYSYPYREVSSLFHPENASSLPPLSTSDTISASSSLFLSTFPGSQNRPTQRLCPPSLRYPLSLERRSTIEGEGKKEISSKEKGIGEDLSPQIPVTAASIRGLQVAEKEEDVLAEETSEFSDRRGRVNESSLMSSLFSHDLAFSKGMAGSSSTSSAEARFSSDLKKQKERISSPNESVGSSQPPVSFSSFSLCSSVLSSLSSSPILSPRRHHLPPVTSLPPRNMNTKTPSSLPPQPLPSTLPSFPSPLITPNAASASTASFDERKTSTSDPSSVVDSASFPSFKKTFSFISEAASLPSGNESIFDSKTPWLLETTRNTEGGSNYIQGQNEKEPRQLLRDLPWQQEENQTKEGRDGGPCRESSVTTVGGEHDEGMGHEEAAAFRPRLTRSLTEGTVSRSTSSLEILCPSHSVGFLSIPSSTPRASVSPSLSSNAKRTEIVPALRKVPPPSELPLSDLSDSEEAAALTTAVSSIDMKKTEQPNISQLVLKDSTTMHTALLQQPSLNPPPSSMEDTIPTSSFRRSLSAPCLLRGSVPDLSLPYMELLGIGIGTGVGVSWGGGSLRPSCLGVMRRLYGCASDSDMTSSSDEMDSASDDGSEDMFDGEGFYPDHQSGVRSTKTTNLENARESQRGREDPLEGVTALEDEEAVEEEQKEVENSLTHDFENLSLVAHRTSSARVTAAGADCSQLQSTSSLHHPLKTKQVSHYDFIHGLEGAEGSPFSEDDNVDTVGRKDSLSSSCVSHPNASSDSHAAVADTAPSTSSLPSSFSFPPFDEETEAVATGSLFLPRGVCPTCAGKGHTRRRRRFPWSSLSESSSPHSSASFQKFSEDPFSRPAAPTRRSCGSVKKSSSSRHTSAQAAIANARVFQLGGRQLLRSLRHAYRSRRNKAKKTKGESGGLRPKRFSSPSPAFNFPHEYCRQNYSYPPYAGAHGQLLKQHLYHHHHSSHHLSIPPVSRRHVEMDHNRGAAVSSRIAQQQQLGLEFRHTSMPSTCFLQRASTNSSIQAPCQTTASHCTSNSQQFVASTGSAGSEFIDAAANVGPSCWPQLDAETALRLGLGLGLGMGMSGSIRDMSSAQHPMHHMLPQWLLPCSHAQVAKSPEPVGVSCSGESFTGTLQHTHTFGSSCNAAASESLNNSASDNSDMSGPHATFPHPSNYPGLLDWLYQLHQYHQHYANKPAAHPTSLSPTQAFPPTASACLNLSPFPQEPCVAAPQSINASTSSTGLKEQNSGVLRTAAASQSCPAITSVRDAMEKPMEITSAGHTLSQTCIKDPSDTSFGFNSISPASTSFLASVEDDNLPCYRGPQKLNCDIATETVGIPGRSRARTQATGTASPCSMSESTTINTQTPHSDGTSSEVDSLKAVNVVCHHRVASTPSYPKIGGAIPDHDCDLNRRCVKHSQDRHPCHRYYTAPAPESRMSVRPPLPPDSSSFRIPASLYLERGSESELLSLDPVDTLPKFSDDVCSLQLGGDTSQPAMQKTEIYAETEVSGKAGRFFVEKGKTRKERLEGKSAFGSKPTKEGGSSPSLHHVSQSLYITYTPPAGSQPGTALGGVRSPKSPRAATPRSLTCAPNTHSLDLREVGVASGSIICVENKSGDDTGHSAPEGSMKVQAMVARASEKKGTT